MNNKYTEQSLFESDIYQGNIPEDSKDNNSPESSSTKVKHIKSVQEESLANEYSISGWLVFYKKNIHKMIQTRLNHQKQKNYQKLKFTYCFYQLFNDIDVCSLICDKI